MAVVPLKYLGGMDQFNPTTSVPGALATDNQYFDVTNYNGNYRMDEVNEQVAELNHETSAFYAVMNMFKKGKSVGSPLYRWSLSDVPQVLTTVTSQAAADATSISVADSTVFQPGMVILNQRTGEILMMVRTKMTSLTAIDVTGGRAKLGTNAAICQAGDVLIAMGSTLAERGTATEANMQIPVFKDNLVSFFATKVSVTELQDKTTGMKFGINFPNSVRNAWFKLNRQVATAMMHSRRAHVDTSEGRAYYMDGFIPQVTSNHLDLSGTDGVLTWPMLNDWLENIAEPSASSPKKTLFCGNKLFNAINMISYNKTQPVVYETKLGTQVMSIGTTHGLEVDIVLDRHIFPRMHSGNGALIDMNNVEMIQHNGFDFQVRENIQANDSHTREDEIYGSASVKVSHEETHGLIKGVVGGY